MLLRLTTASLLLLLVAGLLTWSAGAPPRRERVAFQNRLGDEVEGNLFYPPGPPPWTAVLTIHSIWQTEEMTSPLAEELARNGFLAFDPPLDVQRLDLKLQGTVRAPQVALLGVLMLGAVLAWHQVQAAEYALDLGDAMRVGRIFLDLLAVPALVGAAILRTPLFRP
ncbi:MAG: hypothetical protein ACYCW6_04610 [Candidatus Xenobia bacterium]